MRYQVVLVAILILFAFGGFVQAEVEIQSEKVAVDRGTTEQSALQHPAMARQVTTVYEPGPFSPEAELIRWEYKRVTTQVEDHPRPLWDEAPGSPAPGDERSYEWTSDNYRHSETQRYMEVDEGVFDWVTIHYERELIGDTEEP